MKFFLDTAEVKEIKEWLPTGLVDGVTTNPSLIAKSGQDFLKVIAEIAEMVPGPVSAEVTATDAKTMIQEGKKLAKIAKNIAIKVPLTVDGITACHALAGEGIQVNVTLCFTANQALLAAKAGAAFISPFIGRLDDVSTDGLNLIGDICDIYSNYDFTTEILVASVRQPLHVYESARMGADVVTVPAKVLAQMFKHPLTDMGLEKFLEDWKSTGQSIL